MTRSFAKMYGLRAKNKSKMAIKPGFDDEDEEEVTDMAHPKNLKEAAHTDKITKEAWAKVMVYRKATALTAAPRTATAPTLGPENTTGPTPAPEGRDCPSPVPGPSNPLNLGGRTEVLLSVQMGNWHKIKTSGECLHLQGFRFLVFLFSSLSNVISHKP